MGIARMGALVCLIVGCVLSMLSGCSGTSAPADAASTVDVSSLPIEQQVIEAAITGNVDRLKALIASDATLVNLQDDDNRTPLHFAAAHGRNAAVKYLLENGADPLIEDSDGFCPQATAAQWGNLDTAKVIGEAVQEAVQATQ